MSNTNEKHKHSYRTCDNSYEDEKGSFICGTNHTEYTTMYMDFPNDDLHHFTIGEVITNIGKDIPVVKLLITDMIHYKKGYIRYQVHHEVPIPYQLISKGTQWRRV